MSPRRATPPPRARSTSWGPRSSPLGLVGLAGGLIEAPTDGWSSPLVMAMLGGRRRLPSSPSWWPSDGSAIPCCLWPSSGSQQFSATNAVTFVVYAALGGALFLLPVQLQQVSHYSPLEAGSSLLPLTAVMLAFSARSGALAVRIGPRLQMAVGPVVVGAGMVLLRLIGPSGDYLTEVLPGVLVLAVGLAITVAPAHRHRAVLGSGRARRDGVGGQQRRGPGRRADRGGAAAGAVGAERAQLRPPRGVRGRVPPRRGLRRGRRRRRRASWPRR